jgi:hypothetical protein
MKDLNNLLFLVEIQINCHQFPFDFSLHISVLQSLPSNTNQITCHHLELASQFIFYL